MLKLRSTLLPECEAYGFETVGDRQNPFVSYINNVYLKYKDSFSVEKYNAIHNLVSQGQLSGKDLAGQGVMGQGNLVFCKELYALDANVQESKASSCLSNGTLLAS